MAEANWGAPPAYRGTYGASSMQDSGAPESGEWAAYSAQEPAGGVDTLDEQPARGGGFINIFAAGLSLALLVGMGVWGYKLAVRDVTGVPVVRALEGPMRIQPDDPGGEEAAYQGFSVNAVQGAGGAAAPADTLALAPRDTGLAPEDLAPAPVASVSAAPPEAVQPADATDAAAAQAAALADQVSEGVAPLSQVTQTSAPSVEATLRAADQAVAAVAAAFAPAVQVIPASVPGVARSPRPVARPDGLVALAVAQAAPGAEEAAVELAAAQIPAGTHLVQLGAFDSPEVARAEWDRLATRFADYFGDKKRVVMEASSGGRKFWRLRAASFKDLADARRFCAVLSATRAPCIPVVTR